MRKGRPSSGVEQPHGSHHAAEPGRHHRRRRKSGIKVGLVVVEPGRVPEAFGERVGVDLEFGDQLVLVRRDRGEDRLGEDVGVVVFLLEVDDGAGGTLATGD